MKSTGQSYKALVVAETDKVMNLTLKAVSRLGPKVKSVRAVRAAASRFGDRIAANPSPLRVEAVWSKNSTDDPSVVILPSA
jgi:hypothetical protein